MALYSIAHNLIFFMIKKRLFIVYITLRTKWFLSVILYKAATLWPADYRSP